MSSGEKTEQPTPKKLRDARQKGQVATSRDVSSTALLMAIFAVLFFGGSGIYQRLCEMILFPGDFVDQPFEEAFPAVLQFTLRGIALVSLPVLGVAIVVGVFVNYLQTGPLFSMEPVKPNLNKLNPIEKGKQIFSLKNIMEFVKSNIKVMFLGILLYIVIRGAIPNLVELPYVGINGVVTILSQLLRRIASYTILAYVVIAAADFLFQRWQHNKQLMMTKDEVKQEYKEMEGDPMIKGKRKQLHQEMAMGGAAAKVRKSTVLVTNPTHRAIAIYYKEGETKLPIVLAMGEGLLAKRMIEVAKEEGIPIMQNVPLAHDLFDNSHVEQYIPRELIEPVAEVLRWVRQLAKDELS